MTVLSKKRILVTRPADDDELPALLRARGAVPLAAATIVFSAPDDEAAIAAALRRIDTFDWCAFSSARGVEAFFARIGTQPYDRTHLERVRFAVVGERTQAALRGHGFEAAIVPSRFDGKTLGATLAQRTAPSDRILVVAAQEGRDAVARSLRDADRAVTVVAGYKTVHVRDARIATLAREADVWTFASPSAAHGLFENLNAVAEAGGKVIACIGQTTASAVQSLHLEVDIVAQRSTAAGLVDALEEYYAKRPPCP